MSAVFQETKNKKGSFGAYLKRRGVFKEEKQKNRKTNRKMLDDIYQKNLAGLLLVCGALLATQGTKESPARDAAAKGKPAHARASQTPFYIAYALVMASDWLQGPYLYSLYRDEHGVAPSLISALFTTGFLSGAVSAYFTGSIADRRGRRLACLAFCAISSLSCLLTAAAGPSLPLLFAGRVLGGVGTSLLFSVFDTWMVTDFARRGLAKRGHDLSTTFGVMSTINSVVAIASGVSSEWLVDWAGTRKAPFIFSVGLLGLAAACISSQWVSFSFFILFLRQSIPPAVWALSYPLSHPFFTSLYGLHERGAPSCRMLPERITDMSPPFLAPSRWKTTARA